MKINETSNNSFQNKVLIDTFIEQISALQTDVGNLQIADDNFAQELTAKANTADIANEVVTDSLDAQTATIKTLDVQGEHSSATIENATLGSVSIGTENVNQSDITNLHAMDIHTGTVRTGTLHVNNDTTIGGNIVSQDINAKDITSSSVSTLNVVAAEGEVNKLEAQTAEVTDKLTVNDLEVSGTFTGISHIETEEVDAESVKSDEAEIETLKTENIRDWVSQVMNRTYALTPSPQLGNVDRYTIELPSFDGVFLLSWEDSTNVIWSATVIGNGQTYGISWGSRTDENFITDLFEYRGKLYIRINCNGRLKYAYSATQELDEITIYYNMDGWTSDKSLEELCDENTHIINVYPSGMAWFGPVFIPRLNTLPGEDFNIVFRGSCALEELPSLVDSEIGDVWNITTYGYTNSNFVEGPGNPINIGDDVIAVVEEIEDGAVIDAPLPIIPEGHIFECIHHFSTATILIESWIDENYSNYCNLWKKTPSSWVKVLENAHGINSIWPIEYDGWLYLFDDPNEWQANSMIYSKDGGNTWLGTGPMGPYPFVTGAAAFNGKIYFSTRSGILSVFDPETENVSSVDLQYATIEGYSDTQFNGIEPIFTTEDGALVLFAKLYSPSLTSIVTVKTYDLTTFTVISNTSYYEEWGFGQFTKLSNGRWILPSRGKYTDNEGVTWGDLDTYSGFKSVSEINGTVYGSDGYVSEDFCETWTKLDNVNYGEPWAETANRIWFIANSSANSKLLIKDQTKILKWDKFAAGVNYENFVAEKITATDELKSETKFIAETEAYLDGTVKTNNSAIEVEADIEQTGDYTQTGDYNLTGDQNVTGSVTISEKETINNLAPEASGTYVDENHQYTVADEVLTTNGSEKVTRDLKVQGWIYQDDYNRAILPNINANTINSNGGTLVIGELL